VTGLEDLVQRDGNRWRCRACGFVVDEHRREQHEAGVDPSRPECSHQDARAMAEQREPRAHSLAERLFGTGVP
jgi:hypothetical protein